MRIGVTVGCVALLTSWLATGQSAPSFEAASVKVDTVGTNEGPGRGREEIQRDPARLTMRNVRLSSCIQWAYHLADYQVMGPDWISQDRFDVVAKSANPASEDEMRVMLQALLAERFHLTFHWQTKEASTFVLAVGKGGPKFKESTTEGQSAVNGNQMNLSVQRITMRDFAAVVSRPLGTPVTDGTGLSGKYDFSLDLRAYLPDKCRDAPCVAGEVDVPNIIATALQSQLGLRLDAKKGPVDVLVVDKADRTPAAD